jgi:peptide/nickel transport system permease protein
MRLAVKIVLRCARVFSLVVLAGLGTIILMRVAPGYFSDEREMDSQYSAVGRAAVDARQSAEGSALDSIKLTVSEWGRGQLGVSRHYDVPVKELIHARAAATFKLLAVAVAAGWLFSFAAAVLLAARRTTRGEALIAGSTALLLAAPAGVLALICLLTDKDGPTIVLAFLVAVRDFKLLYRMLSAAMRTPQILFARAQGLRFAQIVRVHLIRGVGRELLAMGMMSIAVALSAVVPVEVIFDVPGLGQLAWNAAMNRDLPVLVAITVLMATCVGVASLFADAGRTEEAAQCA